MEERGRKREKKKGIGNGLLLENGLRERETETETDRERQRERKRETQRETERRHG